MCLQVFIGKDRCIRVNLGQTRSNPDYVDFCDGNDLWDQPLEMDWSVPDLTEPSCRFGLRFDMLDRSLELVWSAPNPSLSSGNDL